MINTKLPTWFCHSVASFGNKETAALSFTKSAKTLRSATVRSQIPRDPVVSLKHRDRRKEPEWFSRSDSTEEKPGRPILLLISWSHDDHFAISRCVAPHFAGDPEIDFGFSIQRDEVRIRLEPR